jgi:hypothetical protein
MARNARVSRSARAEPDDDDESRRSNDRDPQEEDQGQDPAAAAVEARNPNAPAAAEVPAPRVPVAEQRNPDEANLRAPAQQVYALCPGQVNPNAPLDFTKATDVKIYNSAMEPFNKDKPFDVESSGLMQFMMEVHNRANEHGWTDPNHGLCMITVMENGATEK